MLKGWDTSSNNLDCHVHTLYITHLLPHRSITIMVKVIQKKILIFNVCNIACISRSRIQGYSNTFLEEMQN